MGERIESQREACLKTREPVCLFWKCLENAQCSMLYKRERGEHMHERERTGWMLTKILVIHYREFVHHAQWKTCLFESHEPMSIVIIMHMSRETEREIFGGSRCYFSAFHRHLEMQKKKVRRIGLKIENAQEHKSHNTVCLEIEREEARKTHTATKRKT